MSGYGITMRHDASDEAFLTAIVEDVQGGKIVKSIIQNENISDVIEIEAIKEFLAMINGTTVNELPPIEDFLENNVFVLPAKDKIGDNFIKEVDVDDLSSVGKNL